MEIITIDKALYARVRAFIRTIANRCTENCFRVNSIACNNCYSRIAKILAREMDMKMNIDKNQVHLKSNLGNRGEKLIVIKKAILDYMVKKDIPLSSRDIKLPQYTWSMKQYTLLKMLAEGKLQRTLSPTGKFYLYYLKKEQNNENNNTGNGECEASESTSLGTH